MSQKVSYNYVKNREENNSKMLGGLDNIFLIK